ncbi:hypothetical protein NPIL_411591 [Nephila pilipes]|uniref:Uncharacterized protein n=1 Tax=Nephila pilipes TaxID=299642 RepID=A0A8X6MEP2_NEPPI|nr:hypothetical protein NPIL_411591 [Nephila pilipes]
MRNSGNKVSLSVARRGRLWEKCRNEKNGRLHRLPSVILLSDNDGDAGGCWLLWLTIETQNVRTNRCWTDCCLPTWYASGTFTRPTHIEQACEYYQAGSRKPVGLSDDGNVYNENIEKTAAW